MSWPSARARSRAKSSASAAAACPTPAAAASEISWCRRSLKFPRSCCPTRRSSCESWRRWSGRTFRRTGNRFSRRSRTILEGLKASNGTPGAALAIQRPKRHLPCKYTGDIMAEPTTKSSAEVSDHVFGSGSSADDPAALQTDLTEANERVLRAQAELDNYRKRARREMEEERRYALLPFAKDLLAVVDNLERAIAAAQHGEGAGLLEGVTMVSSQLQ